MPLEHQNSLGSYSTSEDESDDSSASDDSMDGSDNEDTGGSAPSTENSVNNDLHVEDINVGVRRTNSNSSSEPETAKRRRKLMRRRKKQAPLPDLFGEQSAASHDQESKVDEPLGHATAAGTGIALKVSPRRANTAAAAVQHPRPPMSTGTVTIASSIEASQNNSATTTPMADGSPKKMTRQFHTDDPYHSTPRPMSIGQKVQVESAQRRKLFRQTMTSARGESMRNVMQGLHSYDLHNNFDYRRAFALDALVPDRFLRGLPGYEISVEVPENALEDTINQAIVAAEQERARKKRAEAEAQAKAQAQAAQREQAQALARQAQAQMMMQHAQHSNVRQVPPRASSSPSSGAGPRPNPTPRRPSRFHETVTMAGNGKETMSPVTAQQQQQQRMREMPPQHHSAAPFSPPHYKPEAL